jgi:hypothetical protein
MKSPDLDQKYSSVAAVEPDVIKQGFLSLPLETVRRRSIA